MTARDLPFGAAPKLAQDFAGIEGRLPYELAEHFLHTLARIEELWPERAVLDYLDGLLFADRPDRQGFTVEALGEVFFIKQLHEFLYPEAEREMQATATGLIDLPSRPKSVQELSAWYPARAVSTSAPPNRVVAGSTADQRPATSEPYRGSMFDAPHAQSCWPQIESNHDLRTLLQRRATGQPLLGTTRTRLGEILVARGIVPEAQVTRALELQARERDGGRPLLGQILIKLGAATAEDTIRALCVQEGVPLVDLDRLEVSADARSKIPFHLARQHRAVPVMRVGNILALAVEDPFSFASKDYLSFYTNLSVELVCASRVAIAWRLEHYEAGRSAAQIEHEFKAIAQQALRHAPRSPKPDAPAAPSRAGTEDDATVIDLVNKMVNDALSQKASDIHIETRGTDEPSLIRFRRDGRLERYAEFPSASHEAVMARLKIMADLDIAEKRKSQDGKIDFSRFTGRKLEIRVSTIPTARGMESATLRLLASGEPLPLERIGMSQRDLASLEEAIAQPHGLVLVCGPTGSGKTTTLHSVLARLNTPERKIWTAEDPVEITQKGLSQVQVLPKIGWSFAQALRSFLRADPDVIMIGEMRDEETASIAVEASMTGHLVLSTLHTNSSADSAVRLLDLGVDPFALSDALVAIVSQRLARRLCMHCRVAQPMTPEELSALASEFLYAAHRPPPARGERDRLMSDWQVSYATNEGLMQYRAPGCDKCKGTGYAGRLGVYEILPAHDAVRQAIRERAPATGIAQAARAGGMLTLKQDGMLKALQGLTDMREVRAACA
jgi:type II secretory ATPase GspE/PulE/Tfp pilus assembly ATPase PilB-like protein